MRLKWRFLWNSVVSPGFEPHSMEETRQLFPKHVDPYQFNQLKLSHSSARVLATVVFAAPVCGFACDYFCLGGLTNHFPAAVKN